MTEVPSGASSGKVTVTTPGSGTLKSNMAFRVMREKKSPRARVDAIRDFLDVKETRIGIRNPN